jgi:malonyl-CoA decarboxylase
MGGMMIKRAVQQLQMELPSVQTFCTLSPMPGFANWVRQLTSEQVKGMVSPRLHAYLQSITAQNTTLSKQLSDTPWQNTQEIQSLVMELSARYLFQAKSPNGIHAHDPVGNFNQFNSVNCIDWC